jgi:adenosylhomocysteine nucleosidase
MASPAARPGARVGILAAMDRELDAVLADFEATRTERVINRVFHCGVLHGHQAVAVVAGIGKTAVATTTTLLVQHFGVQSVVLTGAAGRVSEELSLGDVVVATHLVHHDLDASPLFPRYHVPGLGTERLAADEGVSALAYAAAQRFIAAEPGGTGKVVRGLVLSGDQFMGAAQIRDLRRRFPGGLAVEMEGAAVAQVCIESGTPYAVVRSISDDGNAETFERFLESDCGRYARGIIGGLLAAMPATDSRSARD